MIKNRIKDKGRELFNEFGFRNITLRDIAISINKSYGNITYHFPTKEHLLQAIFSDMNDRLIALQSNLPKDINYLEYFLLLPYYSFDISVDYLFFFKYFVEIKRAYPKFYEIVEKTNNFRKEKWKDLFILLQQQSYLENTLSEQDLFYIMELSTGIRIFYFMENDLANLNKQIFVQKVNKLLYPYLTKKGKSIYQMNK